MSESTIKKTMNKRFIINLGLLIAGISIVLFLLQTILMGGWIMQMVFGLVSLVVMIVIPIFFVKRERERRGGVITFSQIFGMVFLGLLLGGVISVGFNILYTQVIDPDYVDRMVYETLKSTQSWMEGNVPDEQMSEILTDTENRMIKGYSVMGMLTSFGIIVAVYAVYALILGLAMRKKPPMYATLDETAAS